MGSTFKKPASVGRGKLAEVLLFDGPGGWGEGAGTTWKRYPRRLSPWSRGGCAVRAPKCQGVGRWDPGLAATRPPGAGGGLRALRGRRTFQRGLHSSLAAVAG